MKKNIWIILILCLCSSCVSSNEESKMLEKLNIGNQEIQIRFTSLRSIYENQYPVSTTLEIENKSDLPIYLPWGLAPGYNLIFVSLESNSRSLFAQQLPAPSTDFHSYLTISPGEVGKSELIVAIHRDAGKYNLCAEVLILGENGSDHIEPRICVPITFTGD